MVTSVLIWVCFGIFIVLILFLLPTIISVWTVRFLAQLRKSGCSALERKRDCATGSVLCGISCAFFMQVLFALAPTILDDSNKIPDVGSGIILLCVYLWAAIMLALAIMLGMLPSRKPEKNPGTRRMIRISFCLSVINMIGCLAVEILLAAGIVWVLWLAHGYLMMWG